MDDPLISQIRRALAGTLPDWLGLELVRVEYGALDGRLPLRPEFRAPNGYLHAGTVVTLADTCCGLGSWASLPEGAAGMTTIELKTNFLRTATDPGALFCTARMVHGGRTTQVWDATVSREEDQKAIALFRCTQYLLPGGDDTPRASAP